MNLVFANPVALLGHDVAAAVAAAEGLLLAAFVAEPLHPAARNTRRTNDAMRATERFIVLPFRGAPGAPEMAGVKLINGDANAR
jgi:hypothetical protein